MGVISKRGIRGENKRPGRACQHCDIDFEKCIRLLKQVIRCSWILNVPNANLILLNKCFTSFQSS